MNEQMLNKIFSRMEYKDKIHSYNNSELDIFNEVTSFQQLKTGGYTKMPKQTKIDDFSEDDKVQGSLEFWKPREQKEVVGLFRRWETDSYGEHAVLQTGEDVELHFPNLTALNGKLKQGNVSSGDKIKAVYLGEKKSEKSGRMFENFDVYIKTPE